MAVKIRKRSPGKWIVDVNLNGQQRRIVVGSKSQALVLKDEIELNIARQKLGFLEPRKEKITFNSVVAEWFVDHKETLKPSTEERYETILRLYLKPKFGRYDIRDIARADVLTYLKDMHRKGKSQSVIQVMCSVLSQVFLYSLDNEIIERNPASELSRSLRIKRTKNDDEPFTSSELEQLIEGAPEHLKVFFLFAFRTGCRLGEILGLHWKDIDGHTVTIRRSCNRKRIGTPKNGKERRIDLSPQLVEALKKHKKLDLERCIKSGQKPEIVFNKVGDYMYNEYIRRAWTKMLNNAGIEYRKFHHIRHTVASLLIDAGLPPTAVQHQLGHHSAQFTLDVYAKRVKRKESVTGVLDSATG